MQQLVGMVESFNVLEDVSRTDKVPVHSLSLQSLARLWLEIAATDGHLLCNEHYTQEELEGVAYAEWNKQNGAEIAEAIKKLFPEGKVCLLEMYNDVLRSNRYSHSLKSFYYSTVGTHRTH